MDGLRIEAGGLQAGRWIAVLAVACLSGSALADSAKLPSGVVLSDGRFLHAIGMEVDNEGFAVLSMADGDSLVLPSTGIAIASPGLWGDSRGAVDAWWADAGEHAGLLAAAAVRHRLPPELLVALARVESGFNAEAVSPKGARGLLQLMPATARRFGAVDPFDVAQNVEAGARYLSWLLDRFKGRLDLALAGYNAGENAVARYSGVPPYRETRNYVNRVTRFAKSYGLETNPAPTKPQD